MTKEEILSFLCSLPLFENCEPGISFSKKIFYRGDPVSDCYEGVRSVGIVAEGEIAVLSVPGEGTAQTVSVLGRGGMFGICNILAQQPMPTSLVCRKKAVVAYITKDDFAALIAGSPAFALRYAELCNEKILFLAKKLEFSNIASASGKVRAYLRKNADFSGKYPTVPVSSKERMCREIGISRTSLFRELTKLRNVGIIAGEEDQIYILKEDFI